MKDPLRSCRICPRDCGVDRAKGERGFCGAGALAEVYSAHLHYGEEPPVSGRRGSGTVFFSHCNLRCVYCQNHQFSQDGGGREYDVGALAGLMLGLEASGAHNINLVTPTHYAPQIIDAVTAARKRGLAVPIVYNTSGYEKVGMLKRLEGLVQVYLVDMRYGDDAPAERFSSAPDYVEVNRAAVKEMQRQTGVLELSDDGIAKKGLIVRHLVLPKDMSGTEAVLGFIAGEISPDTYVSFMSQYYPAYRAREYPDIARRITSEEYETALDMLHGCGLHNGWVQSYMGGAVDPDFAGTDMEPM